MTKELLTLNVNGDRLTVAAEPHHTLLEVLREECGLTGTKHGCELGECGACTVLVDDLPVLSCLTLPAQVGESAITTVEGLARGGELHPLQTAFAEEGAAQCGYCTPGMLMAAKALLDIDPRVTREDIAQAIAGNLCRCTGYTAIYEAVERAALEMRGTHRTTLGGSAARADAAGSSANERAGRAQASGAYGARSAERSADGPAR